MLLVIVSLALGVWVWWNAGKRGMPDRVWWGVATAVLAIVAMPLYFAKRRLLHGEVREGGVGWNVCKSFALFWTAIILYMAIGSAIMIAVFGGGGASRTGVMTLVGFGILGVVWFPPVLGALVLGLLLRQSSVVERGDLAAANASDVHATPR